MLKLVMPLCAALALAGCQSSTSFAQLKPEDKHALIRTMGQDCKEIGFTPGTTEFAECIQTAIVERDNNISRREAANEIAASQPFLCPDTIDPWACF
ncbi:MAG: hypothetical protein AAGC96_06205 [Pseudomonadota bacterium]